MTPERAGVGELVLASLYLAPSAAREARLREKAEAVADWDGALVALEAHGVLGLAARNLAAAGARLPAAAAERLATRARAMAARERAFVELMVRILAAARAAGVRVTLLKGAALVPDLYPPGGLRAQGDLDLLVAPRDLPALLAAARTAGLAPPRGAFPGWWYRLAHYHRKLVPCDGTPLEVELHWHLHAPAHLYAVRGEDLRARQRPVGAHPAFELERLDRFLHLATHLVRHCPLRGIAPETLAAWAAEPRAPLRLKWLLDLAAEVERGHAELDPGALAARAREWNAEQDLAEVLAALERLADLPEAARAWSARTRERLPPPPAPQTPVPALREAPMAGLDLRPSALRALGAWLWPPRARCARLAPAGPARLAWRLRHAGRAGAHAALVALVTPLAWLARTRRDPRAGLSAARAVAPGPGGGADAPLPDR
ncbi:MAG TPA: nucleotidyltransferase family protein [Planctomycetota bacterium]